MHTIHFILHFKPIVFRKIDNGHHCVGWKRFDIVFELFIFPPHASKLCFTKCNNFDFKQSMNSFKMYICIPGSNSSMPCQTLPLWSQEQNSSYFKIDLGLGFRVRVRSRFTSTSKLYHTMRNHVHGDHIALQLKLKIHSSTTMLQLCSPKSNSYATIIYKYVDLINAFPHQKINQLYGSCIIVLNVFCIHTVFTHAINYV